MGLRIRYCFHLKKFSIRHHNKSIRFFTECLSKADETRKN